MVVTSHEVGHGGLKTVRRLSRGAVPPCGPPVVVIEVTASYGYRRQIRERCRPIEGWLNVGMEMLSRALAGAGSATRCITAVPLSSLPSTWLTLSRSA